tara:strand:- start:22064 stop:22630 length:567 start_codon:yes stop_codon:yes gene_type:complete
MSVITFNEYGQLEEDQIIRDFLLENNLISEKDLNENPVARGLFKKFLRPVGTRIQLLFWNQYSKRAMANMFGGIAVFAYMIPTAAALATLIAAWFGIPIDVAIKIAKGIFYVGMTLGAAFIAMMGRRAALKFINFVNKGRIDKDIQKLEKNKKLTKADLDKIKKIAKKYNTKKSLNKKELEKFKKKVA